MRIALPLLVYFAIMWGGGYLLGAPIGGVPTHHHAAFTAAGNNFELAIAVAIATDGRRPDKRSPESSAPSSRSPVLRRPRLRLPGALENASRRGTPPPTGREKLSVSKGAKPAVLFVCVKNGGKSQMAAGLMRHSAGDRVDIYSAGTKPGAEINALAAASLAEVGVDIRGEKPKAIDPDLLRRVDLVVTLGREAKVDPAPGAQLENWDTAEPSDRGIDGIETHAAGSRRHRGTRERPCLPTGSHEVTRPSTSRAHREPMGASSRNER